MHLLETCCCSLCVLLILETHSWTWFFVELPSLAWQLAPTRVYL
jgi:hypothetical protein